MKSLVDIQQDIGILNNTVKNVSKALINIQADIDEWRTTATEKDVNYSEIKFFSKKLPFQKHPILMLKDKQISCIYLKMLAKLIRLEDEDKKKIKQLVFVQWVLEQTQLKYSLEELLQESYKVRKDDICRFVEEVPQVYLEHFFVDALICSNIDGVASRETLEYLADLGNIFQLDKNDVRLLGLVARVVLSQNMQGIGRDEIEQVLQKLNEYEGYINVSVLKEGIRLQRSVAMMLKEEDVFDLKWFAKPMQRVQKNDTIATYKKQIRSNLYEVKITAEISGIIYRFWDKGMLYVVVSSQLDDVESIKKWRGI